MVRVPHQELAFSKINDVFCILFDVHGLGIPLDLAVA